jgi:hypothetical protein
LATVLAHPECGFDKNWEIFTQRPPFVSEEEWEHRKAALTQADIREKVTYH